MSNDQKIEQVYHELNLMHDDMRTLLYSIWKHNPGVESNDDEIVPLCTIAATMGTMSYQLNNLRVDVIKIREAEQLEEA